MSEFSTLVVPYDFSEHAQSALETACRLARRLDADLHLVNVVQHPSYLYAGYALGASLETPAFDIAGLRQSAMSSLQEIADALSGEFTGKLEPHVLEGPGVADVIRELADRLHADLIVMGTHGRTGLAKVFLGSVTERTLRGAPCPVVAVQAPQAGGPG